MCSEPQVLAVVGFDNCARTKAVSGTEPTCICISTVSHHPPSLCNDNDQS